MTESRYFNQNQIKGLVKTGDIILPGTDSMPSFSQTGCMEHMDRMLAYLTNDDLNGLRLVFGVLRWAPRLLILLLLLVCKHNRWFPGFIGAGLRMLEIGIKGAVLSPYYANLTSRDYGGPKVFDVIGWDAKVHVQEDRNANRNLRRAAE